MTLLISAYIAHGNVALIASIVPETGWQTDASIVASSEDSFFPLPFVIRSVIIKAFISDDNNRKKSS